MLTSNLVTTENADLKELSKFSQLAYSWWDTNGEMKLLHIINPFRLKWIRQNIELTGKKILDVGCGGGILAESLASAGATVKGIDLSDAALKVAKLHGLESGIAVSYEKISVENLAEREAGQYDAIVCMEMLEHVPNPRSIVAACVRLLKPTGKLFCSTINRTAQAYLLAIVGAEYCLKLLAQGTHDYAKFIRPAELAYYARESGLLLEKLTGVSYNPLTSQFHFTRNVDVNYFMMCRKSEF